MTKRPKYQFLKLILLPSRKQKKQIERNLYVQRILFNACIYYVKYVKEHTGQFPKRNEINRLSDDIWQKNGWMHDGVAYSSFKSMANRISDFCSAADKGHGYHPRYKNGNNLRSFVYESSKGFAIQSIEADGKIKRYLQLEGFERPIRTVKMVKIKGTPVSCTICKSKNKTPKYWCVIKVQRRKNDRSHSIRGSAETHPPN